MKKLIVILMFSLGINLYSQQFNIITYNIRFNNPEDGENAWPNRKENVCQLLHFHDAAIFGMQEALVDQVKDVASQFEGYSWIGVGRDDGKEKGEYSPIFYSEKLFKVENKGWFWLSETPDKPSMGWDAACIRICTWAIFTHKESGRKFIVFNTHFDHKGDTARLNSVDLIISKIKELNPDNLPLIFMGDLNLTPDKEPIVKLKNYLHDSKNMSEEPPYGPEGTFNGFDFLSGLPNRIDYIFVNDKIEVKKYVVLTDSKDKHYFSDHLPVFVKMNLD